jgi:hypothetical protein
VDELNLNSTKVVSSTPKKRKGFKFLIIFFLIICTILFLRFVVGGPEDSWICSGGQWITHGKPSYPKPISSCGQQTTLPKTKDDCLKVDGLWKKLGPDPFESCNLKAKDSGNVCRDDSECEGMCLVELTKEELSKGMRGITPTDKKYGKCSEWVVVLGCRGIMKNGKALVICIS